jgi:hypothetical protein
LVFGDRGDELGDPFAARGDGPEHGRTAVSQIPQGDICASTICFIHDNDVSYFQQARLHRLHLIAEAGCHDRDDRVGDINDVYFVLTDPNGFDQNDFVPSRLQDGCGVSGR